jgi:hypothetical protein
MSVVLTPHPLHQLIDDTLEAAQRAEKPFRDHLGGSMIGQECERRIWYGFRWAKIEYHPARIIRLFSRGHFEEFRFVSYLRSAGIEVREFGERLMYHAESDSYTLDPWEVDETQPSAADAGCDDVTGDMTHHRRAEGMGVKVRQWRIEDVDGHFGGSLDGMLLGVPGFKDDEKFLAEFKTHNSASFVKLKQYGMRNSKPEHFAQMQTYMHKMSLTRGIYMAVNKNDDDLYVETVEYLQGFAEALIEKARRIIYSPSPPNRLPGARHASWHECKFCSYKDPCHYGTPMHKSCRSCVNVQPIGGGKWRCNHWDATIPSDAMRAGCDLHKGITD